jgi:hypothetical protein
LLVAPGAYPIRKHLKGPPIGFALALPSNSKTSLERVSNGKPSSLLGLIVSDEGKKFYNIDPRSKPSTSCGPFVDYDAVFEVLSDASVLSEVFLFYPAVVVEINVVLV